MSLFMRPKTQEYSIVDPVQPELNDDIIENDVIKSKIKNLILDSVKTIEKHLKLNVQKVWILGSSLTYQHTPESDIDVTLFIDNYDSEELKDLNKLTNDLFNEKIFIKKHPINFHFVTGRYNRFKADAIYDIKLDKWVKKPESIEEDDIENLIESCQSVKEFNEILEEYINLKKLLESYTGDQEQLEEIFKQTFKVNNLFEKIRDIRREEFKKRKDPKLPSANFRCSNIIYKLLERYGLEDLAQELTKFVQRGF